MKKAKGNRKAKAGRKKVIVREPSKVSKAVSKLKGEKPKERIIEVKDPKKGLLQRLKIKPGELTPGKLPLSIKLRLLFRLKEPDRIKREGEISLRQPFSSIKELYRRAIKKQEKVITEKTKIEPSMQMESIKKRVRGSLEEEGAPPSILAEEVESLKKVLEKKEGFKIYKPSFIGSFANLMLKRLTFYLIEQFPGFFKDMYDSLRLANIRVLSNTYVNIMLLLMLVVPSITAVFFTFFFMLTGNPIQLVISKTIIMFMIMAAVVFTSFYAYPNMRIRARKRNINANLPFAINHIAAVAGSGVAPTKMFKLISESSEYGEIAIEIEKIVEYVELFGYDLLTALRSVASISPSPAFKNFIEGIVSTMESGGDITSYLKDKANEAMLNYELERQKYTETITTYSDIYTGILIAAPLFFIIALSLVAMLGGTVGGIDVRVIIVVGTYFVIPVMNILFLIFLELTQPEI